MNNDFPYLDENMRFTFPPVADSTDEGIVAHGGNLSPGMLLSAYSQGIFPWFSHDEPILWWSPDPRFVLFPDKLHVSSSMKKLIRQDMFRISVDEDFGSVISFCSSVKREGQTGTWITGDMKEAYRELHRRGYAHSVEAWRDGNLVGGLYGVSLGSIFFGESMFSLMPNSSKTAFMVLVWYLREKGFTLIDSQVYTPHLSSLGAQNIPRKRYLSLLKTCLESPTFKGDWKQLFSDFPASRELLALRAVPRAQSGKA